VAAPRLQLIGQLEIAREFARASQLVSGHLMEGVLQEEAERVAESAKQKISVYEGASLDTIRPWAKNDRAAVFQNKAKVSGLRPDYGGLQMTHGLIPALDESAPAFFHDCEKMIVKLGALTGF
jgi:hypothetical protein